MKKLLYILTFFLGYQAWGQLVYVPDSNLREYFKTQLQPVMVGDSLDTFEASNIYQGIDISNRNISDAAVLSYFTRSAFINARNNNLSSFPDLSSFTFAEYVYLDSNSLSSITISSRRDTLQELSLSYNQLTSLPDLSNLSKLEFLYVNNNQLTHFEPFINNDSLKFVELQNNRLSFEDFINAQESPNFGQYTLFPQDSIGPGGVLTKTADSVLYRLNQDTSVFSSEYYWYRNGQLFDITQTPFLFIDAAGTFDVDIVNSNISTLDTLRGLTFEVVEANCQGINDITFQLDPITCDRYGQLAIDESGLVGGRLPFRYNLRDTVSKINYQTSTATFKNIKEGSYELSIDDANGCTTVFPNVLTFTFPLDCPNDIITADNPNFSIDVDGYARIYDRSGKLINRFKTPGVWDGKDLQGNLVSMGLYFIEVEDEVYKVTMIR